MAPPQTLGVPPPPQVCGAVQVPHWTMPPQPSPMGPQLALAEAQVRRPHAGGGLPSGRDALMSAPAAPSSCPTAPMFGLQPAANTASMNAGIQMR